MCGIFGAVLHPLNKLESEVVTTTLESLMYITSTRGRDGYGWAINSRDNDGWDADRWIERVNEGDLLINLPKFNTTFYEQTVLGNFRAEPTTEYVAEKREYDQQPYIVGEWAVAHNGTIANDEELRLNVVSTKIDSAAIVETLERLRTLTESSLQNFTEAVNELQGSYAILASKRSDPGTMYVACNYKPVWYVTNQSGTFFASTKEALQNDYLLGEPAMLEPYSVAKFRPQGIVWRESLYGPTGNKVLCVCSGGLDSVTAAAALKASGANVELAHFVYGCRAEQHEIECVHDVAEYLDVPLHVIPMNIYDPKDSPLLRKDEKVAGGEEGAEFAHEWVPARNLMMLSMATAFAEANGFDKIALGNNLEEAGAYPDNEPEFINRFNALLPFAVQNGKQLEVIQPVGNMMKHEIVALAHQVDAPLHLTWSCYKHGDLHCGQCGPCFMRKTAFEINGLKEVIEYATDNKS